VTALLLAIPGLPLLAAMAALCVGRRSPWGGGEFVVGAVALSLILLIVIPDGANLSGAWFETGGFRLTIGLEVTRLTWFVAMIVVSTALGVGIYSLGYMAQKPDRPRFFAELGLFVGAMLTLVLSSSLILLFAAWELVGLASYLLIGFDYAKTGAPQAAAKAFLMTRIGDVGFLLGWLLALATTGSTNIDVLIAAIGSDRIGSDAITAIAFLVLAGAIGKSAQLPLTGWLPDAMIGPTPVSALLHSATMVAAGVFLVLRLYPVFEAAPAALAALFWIGATTALVAGLIATAEMDLKRVLAWSTVSQLGEMMIALGLGGPLAASFHLAAHAAFKSSLFLAAGAVQEETGTRALDRLGGLIRAMPFTGAVFLVGALALAGVPPLSGFWSEETILAAAARAGAATAFLIIALVLLAGIYIGRATTATFFGGRRPTQMGEPGWPMCVGMGLLALAAVALGWILAGQLGNILPFPAKPEAATAWRLLAVAAAVFGFTFGAWRGFAPAFGPLPVKFGSALMAVTEVPGIWAMQCARLLDPVEDALDKAARGLASGAAVFATTAQSAECGLDAGAKRTADGIWRLARDTERVEALGFGRGGDALVADIAGSGERLRTLQAGQLYLYTLALFLWTAAALVAGGLMLWL
jgi:NADH-quinone oxidoreductase subunit L